MHEIIIAFNSKVDKVMKKIITVTIILQVLGLKQPTTIVAANLIDYMKGPIELKETYIKHLAILVFVKYRYEFLLVLVLNFVAHFPPVHHLMCDFLFTLHYLSPHHLQRKFIRGVPGCRTEKNFHQNYKRWLQSTFPFGIDNSTWEELMEEGSNHSYEQNPLLYPNPGPLKQPVHSQDTSPERGDHFGSFDQLQDDYQSGNQERMYTFLSSNSCTHIIL